MPSITHTDEINKQKQKVQQRIQTIELTLQAFLNAYQLQDIEQLAQILMDQQLSSLFKKKYPQLNKQSQNQSSKLPQKLKKLAFQHTYHEMFIYYQQFPLHINECKNVLKHKYRYDDILRTHQNRKSIWLLCSGAYKQMSQNPHYFQKLSQYQQQYPQFFKTTIQKDVVRTIQDKNQSQNEQILRSVLRKIAIKNPYIGYCQGMNFIVHFLIIMTFTQQQIFWITTMLLEDFLPKTYYTNMMGVAIDICIIEYYVKIYHPLLDEKLQSMNITLSLFTLQWLVCLFTSTVPFYMLVIIWDMMFIYGPSILLKVCIVILVELEEIILNSHELWTAELLIIIQNKKKGIFIEESKFIERINQIYIDESLLAFCRELVQLKLLKEKVQLNQSLGKSNKKNLNIECNIEWPICFKALKQHKSDMGEIQVWTYKQQGPLKIINEYLINKNKKGYKSYQDNRTDRQKLIIGRIPHCCDVNEYNKKNKIQKDSIQLTNIIEKKQIDNEDNFDIGGLMTNNERISFYRRATISNNLGFLSFGNKKDHDMGKSLEVVNERTQHQSSNAYKNNDNKSIIISSKKTNTKHPQKSTHQSFPSKQTHRNSDNQIQKILHKLKSSLKSQFQHSPSPPSPLENKYEVNIKKIEQKQQYNQQSSQNEQKKTKNPFKILKDKWKQRKKSKHFNNNDVLF